MILLKNLYWQEPGQLAFRFNLPVFNNNLDAIGKPLAENLKFDKSTLFIRGGNSGYIQDSDFFRIKNATIGCDLTKLTTKLSFFSKFRLYVAGNNIYTFTKYKGMDPEIGFGNVNQSWAKGIDVGYYPQPRTYMMGLNVNF